MPESYGPIREVREMLSALGYTPRPEAADLPVDPVLHVPAELTVALRGTPESPENRSGANSDAQLIQLWLQTKRSAETRRAYAADWARFESFLMALPRVDSDVMPARPARLCDVSVRHCEAFARQLEESQTPARTAARRISAIKSLLKFAHQTGYLRFNVGTVVKVPPVFNDLAARILSEPEVQAMLQGSRAGRDRIFLRFLYLSGCRVSEATNLRWEHIAEREDHLIVTLQGKGGKTRILALPLTLQRDFRALDRANMSGHVFESKGGRKLGSRDAWRILERASRCIGKRVSPHFLRHSHASHAIRHGAPIHVVQQTLGHRSVQTTGQYLHVEQGESSAMYLTPQG